MSSHCLKTIVEQKQFGWDVKRNLSKINYRIHTDAIQSNLNALFINEGMEQADRLKKLNRPI